MPRPPATPKSWPNRIMVEPGKLASPSGSADVLPEQTVAEPDYAARPSRRLEIAIAASALALSVTALLVSRAIPLRMGGGGIDPRWWPTLLSVLASALSALLVAMSLFGQAPARGEVEAAEPDGWTRMLLALALSALYVFAWSHLGYVGPTLVFNLVLLRIFGLRSWKALGVYSVVTTAFIYGLFHYLLRVPL